MPRIDFARFAALTASLAVACASTKPTTEPAPIVAAAPPEESAAPTPAPTIVAAPSTEGSPSAEGPSAEGPSSEGPSAEGPFFEGPSAEGDPAGEGAAAPSLVGGGTPSGGTLDPSAIRRAITSSLSKTRACYEAELKNDPAFTTRLTLRMVIGKTGTVSSASVNPSSGKPRMDRCILQVVRKIRFPAPKGGDVTVSYPFVFKSS